MKGSLNKGFFTYVLLFLGLIFAVFLVLACIMMFSPGTAILGFAFIKKSDVYEIKSYDGADNTIILNAAGEEIEALADPNFINFQKLNKLEIVANNFDINVFTGDLSYIEVENNITAVTKVNDQTNSFKVTKQYNLLTNTFKIVVSDPSFSINLQDSRKITVFLTEKDYDNLSLDFSAKNGDITFGGSVGEKFAEHQFKNITAKTDDGNISVKDYVSVGNLSVVDLATNKGSVNISEKWGEYGSSGLTIQPKMFLTKLAITANGGKVKTGNLFVSELVLNGSMVDAEIGDVNCPTNIVLAIADPQLKINIDSGLLNIGNVNADIVDSDSKVKQLKINAKIVNGDVSIPSATSADIVIEGITGKALIKTEGGNVTVKDLQKQADISTKSGKVSVLVGENNLETVSITTEKGDITAYFKDVKNNNVLKSTKGDINIVYTEGLIFKLVATGNKIVLKNQNQTHEDTTVTGYPNVGDTEVTTSNVLQITTEKNVNIEKKPDVVWG